MSDNEKRHTRQKKHKLIFDASSFQSNKNSAKLVGDEISGLFTANSKMTSSTRQHSLESENSGDEERIRRFSDAYAAIMSAHQVKPSVPRPSYSGKRWTRDPNIVSALSIDGRSYIDLQRTPTLSLKQMLTSPDVYDSNRGMLNVELHDRKASWLVHLPRTSLKYPTETERGLFQVRQNNIIDEKQTNSPDRKDIISKKIAPLTPCLRKLNDIETKIQAFENRQTFDLEKNRRAVVQAGLPSRQLFVGKRDYAEKSPPVNSFEQLTIDEEHITSPNGRFHNGNLAKNKSLSDSDNNPDIGSTSKVRTSTLRLLFSGVSECKQLHDSNENTARPETKKRVHPDRHKLPSPTSRDERSFNNVEATTTRNHNISSYQSSSDEHSCNHVGVDVEEEKGDTNDFPSRFTMSVKKLDPFDSVNNRLKEASFSQNEESVPQLNVANLVRASLLVHNQSFIDTDENLEDFGDEEEKAMTRSMLMSPSLITKRYQQALCAIEAKNWEQVSYLTQANPWLMEMKDVRNDQYLVHSLALYGGGQNECNGTLADHFSLPEQLVLSIIENEPGAVHKLDTEGNLPLHMAAASGNIMMVKVLGEIFPAAASVQNHDGLLPLHLAVMSCALYASGEHAVDLILNLFPFGLIVKDNDGNTPIHTAAGSLRGDIGVSVISRLFEVHDEILTRNPAFLKKSLCQPKIPKHFDEASMVTLEMEADDVSTDCFLSMMKNDRGDTPLIRAIKSKAGRKMVDTLLGAAGGSLAALDGNSSFPSALHLVLQNEFYDAAVAISILKSAPSAAAIRDFNRYLPIQLACINSLHREVILAIAIIDLPIDLGAKEDVIFREGFGASWWFLLCDSNDECVDIVTEILSLCSHSQKMALCLTISGSSNEATAVASASPQCKAALRSSLRFLGRFEFSGDQNNFASSQEVQIFDAIDYGLNMNPSELGKKVSLICYGNSEAYLREAKHLQEIKLDEGYYEEFEHFVIEESDDANIPVGVKICHCVSVRKSKLSLSRVVAGMPSDHEYRADPNLLRRYFVKVKSIMFCVGQGISNLHAGDVIHGKIDSHSIMKFGEKWKITGLCGSVLRGGHFPLTRFGTHLPPEAMNPNFIAEPSIDIWAFGKLVYESFVGESIFAPFTEYDDEKLQLRCIAGWSNDNVKILTDRLSASGIGAVGIDLVCCCLRMKPDRAQSMTFILRHEFWKEK
jgi:ankyrin repeat protein